METSFVHIILCTSDFFFVYRDKGNFYMVEISYTNKKNL